MWPSPACRSLPGSLSSNHMSLLSRPQKCQVSPLNQFLHVLLPLCEMFFLPPVFLLAPHSSGLSLNVTPADKYSLTALPKEVPSSSPITFYFYILLISKTLIIYFAWLSYILCCLLIICIVCLIIVYLLHQTISSKGMWTISIVLSSIYIQCLAQCPARNKYLLDK